MPHPGPGGGHEATGIPWCFARCDGVAVRINCAKSAGPHWASGQGAANSAVGLAQIATIKQGLRENGLIDGRDYVLEARFAAGHYERFSEMAHDLAQAKVSVILTNTIASVRAAQRLNPPLPVVMIAINDPIGTGLIASLARPGGQTTGLATLNEI
jgi:putative ABC transport system substrate-binding protein